MNIRTFNKSLCLSIGKMVCKDSGLTEEHTDAFYLDWLPDEIFGHMLYNANLDTREDTGGFIYNDYCIPCCFVDYIEYEDEENG